MLNQFHATLTKKKPVCAAKWCGLKTLFRWKNSRFSVEKKWTIVTINTSAVTDFQEANQKKNGEGNLHFSWKTLSNRWNSRRQEETLRFLYQKKFVELCFLPFKWKNNIYIGRHCKKRFRRWEHNKFKTTLARRCWVFFLGLNFFGNCGSCRAWNAFFFSKLPHGLLYQLMLYRYTLHERWFQWNFLIFSINKRHFN